MAKGEQRSNREKEKTEVEKEQDKSHCDAGCRSQRQTQSPARSSRSGFEAAKARVERAFACRMGRYPRLYAGASLSPGRARCVPERDRRDIGGHGPFPS